MGDGGLRDFSLRKTAEPQTPQHASDTCVCAEGRGG